MKGKEEMERCAHLNADFMKTMLVEDLLSDMSLKKLQLIEKCSNLAIANHNFRLL